MRRKLFFYLMITIAALNIAYKFGIPLTFNEPKIYEQKNDTFTGKVINIIGNEEDGWKLEILLDEVDGAKVFPPKKILLSYYKKGDNVKDYMCRTFVFTAETQTARQARNPHCFNYRQYLLSRGVFLVGTAEKIREVPGRFTPLQVYRRFIYKKKCNFEDILSVNTKGMITGVLFGDKSYLAEDEYEDFRKNGTAHILAVSGLHVGIIYGIYNKLVGKRKSKMAIVILAVVLFSYGSLASWSPSICRAILMIAMSIIAKCKDLRYDSLTAMSAVAFILIVQNPYVIFGASFQMSFLAITGMSFIKPIIPKAVPDGIATIIAVQAGLLPYQIYQFNFFSMTSWLINIPVVYMAGIFVPLAMIYFVFFSVTGFSEPLKTVTESLAFLISRFNHLTTLDGFAVMDIASPPLGLILTVYALMLFLSSELFLILQHRKAKETIKKIFVSGMGIIIFFQLIFYCPISYDDIVFVDVGQGDCIHLRHGEVDILIDGGGSINYNIGKNTLKPYLLKNGAWNLDAAIATHLHTDHFKGLEELCEEYKVKKLITGLSIGQVLNISDNLTIETLWPLEIDEETGQDENSMCSVFMIEMYNFKVLITGDLDEAGERAMLSYYGENALKADILKIGHHGSKTSSCDEFLDAVSPKYAVIQVGKNNYGHPNPKTIEKCSEKGIIVVRNDLNGAIGFNLKGKELKCHRFISGEGQ